MTYEHYILCNIACILYIIIIIIALTQAWYDSLRMEMAEENIDITLVAPGSVFSNILETAFTETPGKVRNPIK